MDASCSSCSRVSTAPSGCPPLTQGLVGSLRADRPDGKQAAQPGLGCPLARPSSAFEDEEFLVLWRSMRSAQLAPWTADVVRQERAFRWPCSFRLPWRSWATRLKPWLVNWLAGFGCDIELVDCRWLSPGPVRRLWGSGFLVVECAAWCWPAPLLRAIIMVVGGCTNRMMANTPVESIAQRHRPRGVLPRPRRRK